MGFKWRNNKIACRESRVSQKILFGGEVLLPSGEKIAGAPYPIIVNRSRPTDVVIQNSTLIITNDKHDYGIEPFSRYVVLTVKKGTLCKGQ